MSANTYNALTSPGREAQRARQERIDTGWVAKTHVASKDGTIALAATGFNEQDLDQLKRELARQLD